MHDTWLQLKDIAFPALSRDRLQTLQMNLGYLCNLSCIHCHVNAGPRRTELMDRETMAVALDVAEKHAIGSFDLTGGSPEMNPHFRWLVEQARARDIHVMDRLNPTIMLEPGYQWVGPFLAEHQVEAIASLPCHSQTNVDEQRGNGVFEASIKALQQLNQLGYGQADSGLTLNLVYNPNGAFLPPDQQMLERDYHRLLKDNFGIVFNHLFALANLPVKRFGSWLISKGQFDSYMNTLQTAHQDSNLSSVMCRTLISVDYLGHLYDCDFNQMLDLPLGGASASRPHLRDLLSDAPVSRAIAVGGHCYGCTAGQGSSCGGALDESPAPAAALE